MYLNSWWRLHNTLYIWISTRHFIKISPEVLVSTMEKCGLGRIIHLLRFVFTWTDLSRVWIVGLMLTCRNIYSGAMQSSAFRLILLTTFINDFDEDTFIKLAVDISLGGTVNVISDLILSQENLDNLKWCARNNRVKNSKDKYKVFKLGLKN